MFLQQQEQRPASRSGYDYIKLPTPAPTSSKRNTLCGHASWANVVIPGTDYGLGFNFYIPPLNFQTCFSHLTFYIILFLEGVPRELPVVRMI